MDKNVYAIVLENNIIPLKIIKDKVKIIIIKIMTLKIRGILIIHINQICYLNTNNKIKNILLMKYFPIIIILVIANILIIIISVKIIIKLKIEIYSHNNSKNIY